MALLVCPPVYSEQTLDTLVITGTRGERTLTDTPVRTEVISRETLQRQHARDAAQALKYQPGVLLKDIHGKSGTEIWLQGLDANRVLVLVDGRPVSASTGSSVDLTQLSIGNIAQIEIVKGAVSAMHGSSAMGGVINLITQKNDVGWQGEIVIDSGSYGDKNVGGSDLNSQHIGSSAQYGGKRWFSALSADLRDSKGFDLNPNTFSFEGDAGTKLNTAFNLGQEFESGRQWQLDMSHYDEDIYRDFSTYTPGVGNILKKDAEQLQRKSASLSFKLPNLEQHHVSGYVMRERMTDNTQQDVVVTTVVDQQREALLNFNKAELQWDFDISRDNRVTSGLVFYDAELSQTQERKGTSNTKVIEIEPGAAHDNVEVFIQHDWKANSQWEILPGVRYQKDSDFGNHIAPKVNAMYSPTWADDIDLKIRLGAGTGYRIPNLKERYYLFDHSALGYIVLGNRDLTAETSTSYQAGFQFNHGKNRWDLSLFQNDIKDLITTDINDTLSADYNLGVYQYLNVETARTRGIDIIVSRNWRDTLSSQLGYSAINAIDKSTGNRLTQIPEHQIQLSSTWNPGNGKTTLDLLATWQSDEYVDLSNNILSPAWTGIDIKANYHILKDLTLLAGIDNLSDEHQQAGSDGEDLRPKKPRFAYVGLRYQIH